MQFVRTGDRQDANLLVVRKRQGCRIRRNVDLVSKQVRVSIRLIRARYSVMMRREPRKRITFDETGRDAEHLTVGIDARARTLQERGDVGGNVGWWRARWQLDFSSFPLPVVPLSDETIPSLDRQVSRFASHAKRDSLILIDCSRKNIKPAHSVRELNTLSARYHGIGLFTRQAKAYTAVSDFARQHFRGQRCAFAVEAGFHSFAVTIRYREIIGQEDWTRLRRK